MLKTSACLSRKRKKDNELCPGNNFSKEAISAIMSNAMKACDGVNVNDILLLKIAEYSADLLDLMKLLSITITCP